MKTFYEYCNLEYTVVIRINVIGPVLTEKQSLRQH